MKRFVVTALMLFAAVGAVLVYSSLLGEREYRRLIAEGDAALVTDETFRAVEAFTGALTLKPDAMLAHLKRGETYRRRGELPAALRDLRTAGNLDPTATRPLEQLGDLNRARGEYTSAEARYLEYLRLDSDAPRIFYKLGLTRFQDGNAAAAIPPLERAVELDTAFAEAHHVLGLALRERSGPTAALPALRRAIVLSPEGTDARLELADVLGVLGLHEQRIDELEAVAALNPLQPQHQVILGLAYAAAGRTDFGVLTLSRAAERYPDQPHFYVAVGRIWLDLAEREDDPFALGKALEALDPTTVEAVNTSDAYVLRGRVLSLADDVDGARFAFETATGLYPVALEAYARLGDLDQRAGRLAEAHDAFVLHETLATHSLTRKGRAAAARRLAGLSRRLDDPQAEAEWRQRGAELELTSASLWKEAAEAHARASNLTAARRAVQRALDVDPDNVELLDLLRRFDPAPSP